MKPPPVHHPRDILALKTAFRALVDGCGGLEAAALVTRVGRSVLSDYSHPQKPDCLPPVDVVADLEAVAGAPLVTAVQARLARHVLVPLPEAVAGESSAVIAAAFSESSDALCTFVRCMADGEMCDQDRAAIAGELHTAIAAFTAALSKVSGPALPLRGPRAVA